MFFFQEDQQELIAGDCSSASDSVSPLAGSPPPAVVSVDEDETSGEERDVSSINVEPQAQFTFIPCTKNPEASPETQFPSSVVVTAKNDDVTLL